MFDLNLIIASLFAIVGLLIYKLYRRNASFFEKRKVKAPKSFPVLGFMYEMLVKRRNVTDISREYYYQFSDSRYVIKTGSLE